MKKPIYAVTSVSFNKTVYGELYYFKIEFDHIIHGIRPNDIPNLCDAVVDMFEDFCLNMFTGTQDKYLSRIIVLGDKYRVSHFYFEQNETDVIGEMLRIPDENYIGFDFNAHLMRDDGSLEDEDYPIIYGHILKETSQYADDQKE